MIPAKRKKKGNGCGLHVLECFCKSYLRNDVMLIKSTFSPLVFSKLTRAQVVAE